MSRYSVFLFSLTASAGLLAAEPEAEKVRFFEENVRPILAENCHQCHGAQKQNNGLRLDTRAAVDKGGDYGKVIEQGNPDASKLIKAIRHEAGVEPMPREGKRLPDEAIHALEEWVRQGAVWPESPGPAPAEAWRKHWAFQPVQPPAAPAPEAIPESAAAWRVDAVDRFLYQKLAATGLTPSAPAPRDVLIKRAWIDLIGYPPTWEQVEAFKADAAPDAWPRLVDSLLAMPQYGERWARHWMDTARYADTKGYVFQEERRYAYAYTYRDWLIQAYNRDLPYDQFLTAQIAADKSPQATKDTSDLAAMGFLTLGRRFLNNQHDIIDDRLDVVFRGTQALTIGCARCHDHKFDPIPTADYYSLYGVFANSHEPEEKPVLPGMERTPELEAFEKELATLDRKVEEYKQSRLEEALRPEMLAKYRQAATDMKDKPDGERKDQLRERNLNGKLLRRLEEWLAAPGRKPEEEPTPHLRAIPLEELAGGFSRGDREHINKLKAETEKFRATSPAAPPRAMSMADNASFNEPAIFIRGNPGRQGPKVTRRFLTCLSPGEPPALTDGSGRMQLARHIANIENPLTARVYVNRIWGQLFGAPLVDTPADFGVRTAQPVQLDVLDSLAQGFMQEGWRIKALLRRIMLTAAYQQKSTLREDLTAHDPDNKLLGRQNRRRMDFESLRDSLLRVSGTLDSTLYGRPVDLLATPWTGRRTLYGMIDRQNLPGMFRTFDLASPDATAARRYETTVPQQALWMLNHPFVASQSSRIIQDMHAQLDKDPRSWIRSFYRRILQRDPSSRELEVQLAAVEAMHREPRQSGTRWQYGYGTGGTEPITFTPLPHFSQGQWRGSEKMPDPVLSYASLLPGGGHPGDTSRPVIRRWNAPEDGPVSISGRIKLPSKDSTGMDCMILLNGTDKIWSASIPGGGETAADVPSVTLKTGDTLDFIAHCGADPNCDSFEWAPVLTNVKSNAVVAHASQDFGGPGTSAWEACVQVLLCTNEFLFVD